MQSVETSLILLSTSRSSDTFSDPFLSELLGVSQGVISCVCRKTVHQRNSFLSGFVLACFIDVATSLCILFFFCGFCCGIPL